MSPEVRFSGQTVPLSQSLTHEIEGPAGILPALQAAVSHLAALEIVRGHVQAAADGGDVVAHALGTELNLAVLALQHGLSDVGLFHVDERRLSDLPQL